MNNINIKQIIEKFPDCLTNGVKLKAILLDIYPEISKAIVSASVIIVNCGIAKEIRDSKNITALDKSRWEKKLEDDYGLSEKVIERCLNLFLYNSTAIPKSNTSSKSNTTVTAENTIHSSHETIATISTKFANNSSSLMQKIQNVKVGSIIKFGSYWQGSSTSVGKTPIEWRVLAIRSNRALIISENAIDCQQYDKSNTYYVTWESCSLRTWLNKAFFKTAFNADEKRKIRYSYISAPRNSRYCVDSGKATKDKLFLLSINEVDEYFSSYESQECHPTDYAISNGTHTSNNKIATCCWLLRTPGCESNFVAYVGEFGSIFLKGYHVGYPHAGVRPAMWIDLSAGESDA